LVLKTEEPGSKQKLAFQHGRFSSIAYYHKHHKINDIIVMGADPIYIQDCIICGMIEPEVVKTLVSSMAEACRNQGCVLTGGETSVQPGVVSNGVYVLTASGIGVVEKDNIIDGSRIEEGDTVLAVASNGLHTNGYTLVRRLIEQKPELLERNMDDETFLDVILRPHKCYYHAVKDLFNHPGLKGLALITGGGIQDNLNRILPDALDAVIDLHSIRIPGVFGVIRNEGNVPDSDMLRTFNMGVGLTIVCPLHSSENISLHLQKHSCDCYEIGSIVNGSKKVAFEGSLPW
jgi:phosphoribosylformylglycinamidine cyclo-ligase